MRDRSREGPVQLISGGLRVPLLMSVSMTAQRVSSSVRRVVASACTLGVACLSRPPALVAWPLGVLSAGRVPYVRDRWSTSPMWGAVTDRVRVAGRMRPTKTPTLISTLLPPSGHLLTKVD